MMNKKMKQSISTLRSKPASDQKKRFDFFPFAAVLLFACLAILLFISVRFGIQNDDETTCIAGAHRMLFGELPVLENWTIIQFHSFLLYLPFRLLYAVLGGTEGIVLAFRYLYVVIKLLFFAAITAVFRKYRYWALLAALIFTVFHPIGFVTLSYYNVSILCAFAFGLIVFVKPSHTAVDWLCAGVLLAFTVLAEPPVMLIYLAYTALVPVYLFLKKRRLPNLPQLDFVLSFRTWGLITAGAAGVVAIVAAVLLLHADIGTILTNAPGVLRFLQFHPQANQWEKYQTYIWKSGYAPNAAAVLLLIVGAALSFRKKLKKARAPLFAASCAVFIWMTAGLFLRGGRVLSLLYLIDFKPVPLLFLGIASYLFAEKKQRRMGAFLVFGLFFAVCVDLLSRISVGTGGIIAAPACVFLFRQALLETCETFRTKRMEKQKRKTEGRRKSLFAVQTVAAVLAAAVLIVTESAYSFHALVFPTPEGILGTALSERLDRGPMKDLYTIPMLREMYGAVLDDMDTIKKLGPESLFVMHFSEWGNLYLDLPYATFSPDSFDTQASQDCLLYYWSLHPDKKPDFVYIQFFGCNDYQEDIAAAEEKLAFIRSVSTCTYETGKAGFIVRIERWA